jgi:hypothetical protein
LGSFIIKAASSKTGARPAGGFRANCYGFWNLHVGGGISPARRMYSLFRSTLGGVCRAHRPGPRFIPPLQRPLQVRNSPPTQQMRHVMVAAGSTAHSMQVMHRKRAAPRCPSTQPAAGAKSPCGRLVASASMLDDRVGAGRAGFVAQLPCQRCVSHSSCSRPVVGCHRMRTCVHCKPRNHGRATRQRMSLRAATHSGSAVTHRYRTAR